MSENNENNENQKTETLGKPLRKRDLIKQYQEELNKLSTLPDSDEETDSEIEIIQQPKVKKERSQAQKDAFERAKKAREEKIKMRKDENENIKKSKEKEIEEKIIKKAISTRKKQIKEVAKKIEEESDDDLDKKPSNYDTPLPLQVKKPQQLPRSVNIVVEKEKPKIKFV
jgi:hypothetical protein